MFLRRQEHVRPIGVGESVPPHFLELGEEAGRLRAFLARLGLADDELYERRRVDVGEARHYRRSSRCSSRSTESGFFSRAARGAGRSAIARAGATAAPDCIRRCNNPAAGAAGGQFVAAGPPALIAAEPASHTGSALARLRHRE